MKVRGVKLTTRIGASGKRERLPVVVDFVIRNGRLRPINLPSEALQLLWHHHGVAPTDVRRVHEPSALKKALKSVRVDITRGMLEEYPPSSDVSKERELRVGSRVELYTVIDEQQHRLLEGFVTKVETVVFLQ